MKNVVKYCSVLSLRRFYMMILIVVGYTAIFNRILTFTVIISRFAWTSGVFDLEIYKLDMSNLVLCQ